MNWPADLTFFIDEDLGTIVFPATLRDAGVSVEVLPDHFARGTDDTAWIQAVSQQGWVIVTHDRDIRSNALERDAVMDHGGRVIIIRASVARAQMAQIFVDLGDQIIDFLRRHDPPFIARLYRNRIEMWLSRDDWTQWLGWTGPHYPTNKSSGKNADTV